MDIHIERFSTSLQPDEKGIWIPRSGSATGLSYPAQGNAACFRIEEKSFWFQHRNTCLLSLIRRYLPPGNVIFDIGGGNGFQARAMQQAGLAVVLVEPGPEGAFNARNRGVTNVICAISQEAGFSPGSIPAMGMFDVIEHIENDLEFLRFHFSLLQPGGRIFITVPAYNWLWSFEDVHAGHYRRYTTSSICSVLGKVGFEMEFASYLFGVLPIPILLLRSIPTKLGLRKEVHPEKTQAEHSCGVIMQKLLDRESRRIESGKHILVGSSCVVVARKPTT